MTFATQKPWRTLCVRPSPLGAVLNITVSQSLELIAQAFGAADWNTLSAVIREEAAGLHNNNASAPQSTTTATIHRALAYMPASESADQYVGRWSISVSA